MPHKTKTKMQRMRDALEERFALSPGPARPLTFLPNVGGDQLPIRRTVHDDVDLVCSFAKLTAPPDICAAADHGSPSRLLLVLDWLMTSCESIHETVAQAAGLIAPGAVGFKSLVWGSQYPPYRNGRTNRRTPLKLVA